MPLELLLELNTDMLREIMEYSDAPELQRPAQAGGNAARLLALQLCGFVDLLVQFSAESRFPEDMPQAERPSPGEYPSPAARLHNLRAALFGEYPYISAEAMSILQLGLMRSQPRLPHVEQLRRLWALLAWVWAGCLTFGVGRPSWMAGYPGPTRAEAWQLQQEALAAMRSLHPSHPLTELMVAQSTLVTGADSLRRGLQHAAATGGPHGSSMFTAEFAFTLIHTSTPAAGTPPWGRLSLAEAAQLVQQGDTAMARCKALLPPAYLEVLKFKRDLPSVRWRRAAVERHRQAGAAEWQEQLLPARQDHPTTNTVGPYAYYLVRNPKCTSCGRQSIELRSCAACRLPDVKYCRCGGWREGRGVSGRALARSPSCVLPYTPARPNQVAAGRRTRFIVRSPCPLLSKQQGVPSAALAHPQACLQGRASGGGGGGGAAGAVPGWQGRQRPLSAARLSAGAGDLLLLLFCSALDSGLPFRSARIGPPLLCLCIAQTSFLRGVAPLRLVPVCSWHVACTTMWLHLISYV